MMTMTLSYCHLQDYNVMMTMTLSYCHLQDYNVMMTMTLSIDCDTYTKMTYYCM